MHSCTLPNGHGIPASETAALFETAPEGLRNGGDLPTFDVDTQTSSGVFPYASGRDKIKLECDDFPRGRRSAWRRAKEAHIILVVARPLKLYSVQTNLLALINCVMAA